MSMCTHAAGKRVNSYSTWYHFKAKKCQCVHVVKGNVLIRTARGMSSRPRMSMCTHGAGKRVNSYSTWYEFKAKKCRCVHMLQGNVLIRTARGTSSRPTPIYV